MTRATDIEEFSSLVIGVMKRTLKEGMGPTLKDYLVELNEKEMAKPEDSQRRFEDDDVQVACKTASLLF